MARLTSGRAKGAGPLRRERGAGAAEPVFRLGQRPALDGVRAIGVLAVMAWHFVVPGLKGGFLGVDVFFVLSGFLITSLLVEEWDATQSIHLGRFWMRRVLRLFPALLVVLAVTAPFVPRSYTLQALFYVANWGVARGTFGVSPIRHLWSLCVEEQFYIVWPLLLLGMLRARFTRTACLVAVAALTLVSALFKILAWTSPASWVRLFHGSDARADSLLVGCFVGLLLNGRRLHLQHGFRLTVRVLAVPAAALCVFLFTSAAVYWEWLYHQAGFTWTVLAIDVLLLQLLVAPYGWMLRVLEWRPMVAIGRLSYSLYLWHVPAGFLVSPERFPDLGRYPLLAARLAVTLVVATMSYLLVERPMLRLKSKFARARPALEPPPAPQAP